MLQIEKWKIVLVIVLSILGVLYAVPNILPAEQKAWVQANIPDWLPSKTVNLGLDLRGGSYLLLEADTKVVIAERIQSMGRRRAHRAAQAGYRLYRPERRRQQRDLQAARSREGS